MAWDGTIYQVHDRMIKFTKFRVIIQLMISARFLLYHEILGILNKWNTIKSGYHTNGKEWTAILDFVKRCTSTA
jgi:hypothetical protein